MSSCMRKTCVIVVVLGRGGGVRAAADVHLSVCVCVFVWTDICGRSVSAVLGHQFRAAGLLLLNGP